MPRRGRKRKHVHREPNGRRARNLTPKEDMTSTGVQARMRVHGVCETDAKSPEAGDWIGRSHLAGKLSRRQFEALRAYERTLENNARRLQVRRIRSGSVVDDMPRGGHDGSGGDEPAYIAWCEKVADEFKGARSSLTNCGDHMALFCVGWALETGVHPEFMDSLLTGADALAEFYRVPDTKEKAA